MIKISHLFTLTVTVLFYLVALNVTAKENTVNAYAPLDGRGQIYPTGPNQATFVGAFTGVLYVENDDVLSAGGNMICPAIIEIDLDDGKQSGTGHCTLSNELGERIFADWSCSGSYASGCNGTLKLVSGTGVYSGITGQGDMLVRNGLHAIAATMSGNFVKSAGSSLAIWRNLHYTIPENDIDTSELNQQP